MEKLIEENKRLGLATDIEIELVVRCLKSEEEFPRTVRIQGPLVVNVVRGVVQTFGDDNEMCQLELKGYVGGQIEVEL